MLSESTNGRFSPRWNPPPGTSASCSHGRKVAASALARAGQNSGRCLFVTLASGAAHHWFVGVDVSTLTPDPADVRPVPPWNWPTETSDIRRYQVSKLASHDRLIQTRRCRREVLGKEGIILRHQFA
jgi:hypothetical protein